jgi:hypothetical protein
MATMSLPFELSSDLPCFLAVCDRTHEEKIKRRVKMSRSQSGQLAAPMLAKLFLLRQDLKVGRLTLKYFARLNQRSVLSIVSPGGPIVSLTSYGTRIQSVFLTIESIAAGTIKPSRLILWLDDIESMAYLPEPLKRLQLRGLEVRISKNYGPHTKYYPYVASEDKFRDPLVTADDDVIYTRSWLNDLALAHQQNPGMVHCHRAHVVSLVNGSVASYMMWGHCKSTNPSFSNFATGVSGCIYPTELLRRLKGSGSEFLQLCPKADDIWLHVNALRARLKIRQVRSQPMNFPQLPGTESQGRAEENVGLRGNDRQAQATYSRDDLELLGAPYKKVD